jgi:hypothetical protein
MKMELDFDKYLETMNQEMLVNKYNDDNATYNNYMDNLLAKSDVLQHLKTKNSKENLKRYKALYFTSLVNAGYTDNYVGADFNDKNCNKIF